MYRHQTFLAGAGFPFASPASATESIPKAELGVTIGASSIVILTTLVYWVLHVRQKRKERREGYDELDEVKTYEDEDGTATEESEEQYSVLIQKGLVTFGALAGFSCILSEAVSETLATQELERMLVLWMPVGAWICLFTRALGLQFERDYRRTFRLSVHTLLLSALMFIVQVFVTVRSIARNHGDFVLPGLECGAAGSAFLVFLASSCVPRRPNVYHNGGVVEKWFSTSLLSQCLFLDAAELLKIALKKQHFDDGDLPQLDRNRRAEYLLQSYNELKKSPSLAFMLLKMNWKIFVLQFFASAALALMVFTPPLLTSQLLVWLEKRDAGFDIGHMAWAWTLALGVQKLVEALLTGFCFWLPLYSLQIPVRGVLGALVYAKTMRKKDVKGMQKADDTTDPKTGAAEAKNGDDTESEELENMKQGTINLLSVDSHRIANFTSFLHMVIGTVFEAVFGIGFAVYIVGWQSVLAGFSIVLITTPWNAYFSKRYSDAQDDLMKQRDRKIAVVSEALQGIRQIKFSAWEQKWHEKIISVRNDELKALKKVFITDVAVLCVWLINPVILAAVALSVYAIMNGDLKPSVAFPALAIFNELEWSLSIMPELITDTFDALVSVRRIQKYLDSPEKKNATKDTGKVAFRKATIAWAADTEDVEDRFALKDISIDFPLGELSIVTGRTGSGKSLLLAALLDEADLLEGEIEMPHAPSLAERNDSKVHPGNWILPKAVAFVAQSPWIENGTVKDNILFGLPFNERRYRLTLHACALEKDLEMLTDGDQTEIGSNGINLSGGQRWRLSFARAVYSRAGIVIMDDIFSAVDSHVGKHIFENGLTGELMRNRTRILVTHHLKLCISGTSQVISLVNGTIEHQGSIEELQNLGILDSMIKEEDESAVEEEPVTDEALGSARSNLDVRDPFNTDDNELLRVMSRESTRARRMSAIDGTIEGATPPKTPKKFTTDEERERGAVKMSIYTEYIKAAKGYWFWVFLVSMFAVQEGVRVGRNYWIKMWSGSYATESADSLAQGSFAILDYSIHQLQAVASEQKTLVYWVGVYMILSTVAIIIGVGKYAVSYYASLTASRIIFDRMTERILRAPLRWLDTVPAGRIINRFSKDFETMDSQLCNDLIYLLYNGLGLVGVIVAGIVLSPYTVIVAVAFLALNIWYAVYYLSGAREVKRLESVSRSPIFEHFGSTLAGVATIRAFGKSEEYISRMFTHLDAYSQYNYYVWLFNRWVGVRIGLLGAFFTIVIGIVIITLKNVDAAMAGFVLSFALTYNVNVSWALRRYSNTELNMNSTERIIEYTKIETEDQGGDKPPAAWPYDGRVEVNNLVVSYAPDLSPVLKGISFDVKPRERVGIVGRTGAGKSSLTLALFQFIRASSGTIHIDGLDISKVRLHDLRSRLAIIPQDPVLFSGTIRSNLDAFGEYDDKDLEDALARVHLVTKSALQSSRSSASNGASGTVTPNANVFESLDSKVSEGGLNLSQGQRQLLCLARAIVSRPKILVLDEATSAVDLETDTLIQQSIREEFTDCTTLVIAHRLATVADYDRILVLADGEVVEFDSPWRLIEKRGLFWDMCVQSGDSESLVDVARRKAGA